MGKVLSTEPGTQNILKTMVVAIVIIISILVIPEGSTGRCAKEGKGPMGLL